MSPTLSLRGALGLVLGAASVVVAKSHKHWVDVWANMPQAVEPYNLPNAPYVSTPPDVSTSLSYTTGVGRIDELETNPPRRV